MAMATVNFTNWAYSELIGAVFATVRSTVNGGAPSAVFMIPENCFGGANYTIARCIMTGDTTLPVGAVIDDVRLFVWCVMKNLGTEDTYIQLVTGCSAPMVAGDYDITKYSGDYGRIQPADLTDGAYTHVHLTDFSVINATGITNLGLRMGGDVTNTPGPGANEYHLLDGNAHPPYMEIDYHVGGAAPIKSIMMGLLDEGML